MTKEKMYERGEIKNVVSQERKCRHVHIDQRSKTAGTPFLKGYCPKCKAWVHTEENFCICCMKRVKHKTHHLHLRRILNEALKIHVKTVDEYKLFPYRDLTFVEVIFQKRKYHIPLKYLALYDEHPHKNEILPIVQDYICTVRG